MARRPRRPAGRRPSRGGSGRGHDRAHPARAPPAAPPSPQPQPAPWPTGSSAWTSPGRRSSSAWSCASPDDEAAVAARLPASTLRHVLAALSAATARATDEAERAELRARERERERFVSMVAHELRTPLAGLGGYLDLLAGGAVDDPGIGREFIERGRGIVERMAELVGDLLELSRIEARQPPPGDRALLAGRDLRAGPRAAGAARRRARHPARDRPPAADPDGPGRPAACRADRVESRRQRLQVLARGRTRQLGARVDGPAALLVVRDEGQGIERADRELVFRPFARLDGHERVPGTGLGLSISRDLARAMGGDIAVASVPASGSSFIVGLPAVADVPRAAVAAAIGLAADAEEVELEERAILRALRAGDLAGTRGGALAPAPQRAGSPPRRAGTRAIDAA